MLDTSLEGSQPVVDAAGLQRSFGIVAGFGDEVPLYFYSRLFLEHPQTRTMFPASMSAQRDRLVGALVRVVSNVHQVETVVPYLQQLARDHRKYGVLNEHYPAVGGALLATLEHFLGEEWTPELAADWAAAYGVIATVMTQAADEASQSTPPWYDAEIVGHDIRAPGLAVITARPERRLEYVPGQSMSVQTSSTPRIWRYYSPANAPRPDNTIELHVRAVDGGWVSPALVHNAGKGDVLRLGAPVGSGLELDGSNRPIVMLAGGTGLAPLRALVEQLAQQQDGTRQRQVRFYPGARTEQELYDLPALRRLQDDHAWLDVLPVVQLRGAPGLAVGEVAGAAIERQRGGAHDLAGHEIYVCGSPQMVARTLETLASAGLDPERVRREAVSYEGNDLDPVRPASQVLQAPQEPTTASAQKGGSQP